MHKKFITVLALLSMCVVTSAFMAGCKKNTPPDETPAENGQIEQPAENIDTSAITSINEKSAVIIANAGMEIYHSVLSGGIMNNKQQQTLAIDGKEYIWLATDIDTRAKLHSHMEKIFSSNAVDTFIDQAGIIEKDGKLLIRKSELKTKLDWKNAMASWVTGEGDKIEYELKVPYSDGNDVEFTPVLVDYQKIGNVWRITTSPSDME